MTTTDVLTTIFKPEPCDFCPAAGPTYLDPETGCRFCLDCLVLAAEPLPELPPDPEICRMAQTIISERRLNMEGSKQ